MNSTSGPRTFVEKMKASNYPWAAINITNDDGSPIEGLGGVMIKEVGGLKVALIPVAQDTSPEVSSTGSLKFGPTVDMGIAAAKAAREDGADIVVGVVQTNMDNDRALMASHAFDVILSGDDHSYATAYDGVTAYVETSVDAQLLTPIDLMVEVGEKDGKRTISWTPAVPVHRHGHRDAGPRNAGHGRCAERHDGRHAGSADRHAGRPIWTAAAMWCAPKRRPWAT